MSKKRAFSETNGEADMDSSMHPDRRFAPNKHQHAKRQKTDVGDNMSRVKKRARNIERLLQKKQEYGGGLPANKRVELERELAAHRERIASHQDHKHRNKMISKYHMVRFFERQKAGRLAKKLRKRLAGATDPAEVDALRADLHIAEVDEDYARYFPLMERYVSLYAAPGKKEKGEKEEAEETEKPDVVTALLRTERPPMWKVVEEAQREGFHALQRLRDRTSGEEPAREASGKARPGKSSRPRHPGDDRSTSVKPAKSERSRDQKGRGANGPATKVEDDDSGSDGGFFE